MAKNPLTQKLQFEKRNQDLIKLPKYARVQKRPISHPPVASPYAGASVPKIVYVSTNSPFMSAVKRVQKLLRQAEKRATASVNLSNTKKSDKQKLAQVARGLEQLSKEEVFVKATGRAIEKALSVGRWFEQRETEYAVRVKTGSVLAVDDILEDEEAKRKAMDEAEKVRSEQQQLPQQPGSEDDNIATAANAAPQSTEIPVQPLSKSAAKKRKRAANALASADELPETRTRWVNMVEISISLK